MKLTFKLSGMNYIRVYGILYNCPFGRRRVSCPLYDKDHLSLEEKFKWFEALPAEEKNNLANHHLKCLKEREALT